VFVPGLTPTCAWIASRERDASHRLFKVPSNNGAIVSLGVLLVRGGASHESESVAARPVSAGAPPPAGRVVVIVAVVVAPVACNPTVPDAPSAAAAARGRVRVDCWLRNELEASDVMKLSATSLAFCPGVFVLVDPGGGIKTPPSDRMLCRGFGRSLGLGAV
jgi:hypothetical protein